MGKWTEAYLRHIRNSDGFQRAMLTFSTVATLAIIAAVIHGAVEEHGVRMTVIGTVALVLGVVGAITFCLLVYWCLYELPLKIVALRGDDDG